MDIQIFKNERFGEIRVAEVNGEPMFCLADVVKALEYANPAKAVIDHCKGVTILETPTTSGVQPIKYGKESEIYRLVMKSRTARAEQFQDWVCGEVLPSIRKHGAYMTEEIIEKTLTDPDYLIRLATELKKERTARLNAEAVNNQLSNTILANAPKVAFANAIADSDDCCLVRQLAKTLQQSGIKMGEIALFKWLRINGYLLTKGESYNLPSRKSMDADLFRIKKTTIINPDGTTKVTTTPILTGKGQIFFLNKLKKQYGK